MIEQLVTEHLKRQGFDVRSRWSTLQSPWSEQGWPMDLPCPEWTDRTRVVLHFQDRITATATGCKELEAIEAFYQHRANQVVVIFYSHGLNRIYHGPVQLIEFSTHNWLTITDLIRIQKQWQGAFDQPKTMAWQCLNGRTCPHRRQAAYTMAKFDNGIVSYGSEIPLQNWDYSTYFGTENYDNFVRLLPIYQSCQINIVTETDYDQRPGVISEKTLYAFVAKQMPILIAHPGAVQDCRDMGFDMFDDVVDHSYDTLPNDQRISAAIGRNQHLLTSLSNLDQYQSRLQRNHDYALTGFLTWMTQQAQTALTKIF